MIIFRVTTGRSWTNDFASTMPAEGGSLQAGTTRPETLRFRHTTQVGEMESNSSFDFALREAPVERDSEKLETGEVNLGRAI